jgi:glutathione-regulated potassium-efflux system ancillary protein KefC
VDKAGTTPLWMRLTLAAAAIAGVIVIGRYLTRPLLRLIAKTDVREIFTAFTLLLVIGIAELMSLAGLSMALGAFLAGVLLAGSEFRHALEGDIEPFKGLLLGLFFISVGMTIDFGLLLSRPGTVALLLAGFLALKIASLWFVAGRIAICRDSLLFALLLSQGGEFAFYVFQAARDAKLFSGEWEALLTITVALSMATTPLFLLAYDHFMARRGRKEREPDTVTAEGPVIIAGFGRYGQIVGRLLLASDIRAVVLDHDPDQVESLRKFGYKVFYGDATRLDLLHAAGADSAQLLIAALDDDEATTKLVRTVKKHFPKLKIIARAHDMRHLFQLRDLGVEVIERETFLSAVKLGEAALAAACGDAERASRAVQAFGEHDREVVAKLYEVHRDSTTLQVNVSNQLRDQFARTLKADEASLQEDKAGS